MTEFATFCSIDISVNQNWIIGVDWFFFLAVAVIIKQGTHIHKRYGPRLITPSDFCVRDVLSGARQWKWNYITCINTWAKYKIEIKPVCIAKSACVPLCSCHEFHTLTFCRVFFFWPVLQHNKYRLVSFHLHELLKTGFLLFNGTIW